MQSRDSVVVTPILGQVQPSTLTLCCAVETFSITSCSGGDEHAQSQLSLSFTISHSRWTGVYSVTTDLTVRANVRATTTTATATTTTTTTTTTANEFA